MQSLTESRKTAGVLAGLTIVGALAGCSASGAASYADGTYTATGEYQAPSGTESVEVTLTLADNVITAVEVVGDAEDPQAQRHQGQFIDGIADVVVGKNLNEIQVDKVGGSSLTSGGFNRAVDAIKGDAAA